MSGGNQKHPEHPTPSLVRRRSHNHPGRRKASQLDRPNIGFRHQLDIWQGMGMTVYRDRATDELHPLYVDFKLKQAARIKTGPYGRGTHFSFHVLSLQLAGACRARLLHGR